MNCHIRIMIKSLYTISCFSALLLSSCADQPVYQDIPFLQDYAVKYYSGNEDAGLMKVCCDRNGIVQVLASDGLYRPDNGHFQYPGNLKADRTYRPMAHKQISDMILYENQFIYLDDTAVFSNAMAGKLYLRHGMPGAKMLSGGPECPDLLSGNAIRKC